jgi:acyl phosphate:glycerol-3-phosphate acyltransferase
MTVIILIIAYLLGSIPFGLLLVKYAGMGDIRSVGSGNIGATNVMRTGNKKLGIATLLLDAGKGFAAVWLALSTYEQTGLNPFFFGLLAGLVAVLGHVFPVWLKFKGGKGVATAIGVVFAFSWQLGVGMCAVWLAIFAVSRMASVASLAGVWSLPLLIVVWSTLINNAPIPRVICLMFIALALLITWTHRENIKRIHAGTERGFRKEKQ